MESDDFQKNIEIQRDDGDDERQALVIEVEATEFEEHIDVHVNAQASPMTIQKIDKGKQKKYFEDEKIEFVEASTSELIGKICNCEDEAYEMYNNYAYQKCFGIRKHLQKYYVDGEVREKQFCCSCAGKKDLKKLNTRAFSKLDFRTGCKANIKFSVDKNGKWEVTAHQMVHNHPFCDKDKVHMLRSHRLVEKHQLELVSSMKESGVTVAQALLFLNVESGGTSQLGFVKKDMYNALALQQKAYYDGTDANSLIQIFKRREENEKDFYYNFRLDDNGRLSSFFWRDGKMKNDYILFGDLLVFDTTYRTNKYEMICAPFVGMNNHCMNIMFGCGFLLNEQIESFTWLFETFLLSMDGAPPQSIMTDQCPSMAATIVKVFPTSRHRLCIWHILENARKRLPHLMHGEEGFTDQLLNLLRYCETEAEFNNLWNRFIIQYRCEDNVWLMNLYEIRHKWCRAFSKDYFSGGALSSQRSESTNHSISRSLHKTADLCQFYHTFCRVVSEWRENERVEDWKSENTKPDMIISDVKLLIDAREVYTIEAYKLFEKEYMKSLALTQEVFRVGDDGTSTYHVWKRDLDIIKHAVIFNKQISRVYCTCKLLTEVGILCSHSLRILDVNCVDALHDQYILRRWRKDLTSLKRQYEDGSSSQTNKYDCFSQKSWSMMMVRKFHVLLSTSAPNASARKFCEDSWKDLQCKIEKEVGETHIDEGNVNIHQPNAQVQNPEGSKTKGRKSKRLKSTMERKRKSAKQRTKNSVRNFLQKKDLVQRMMNVDEDAQNSGVSFVHPIDGGGSLTRVIPDLEGPAGVV